MATIGEYTFDWITDDEAKQLLGNSRPKTLKDIEKDGYWNAIFARWAREKGHGDLYDKWQADPDGSARDDLKSGGSGDLRNDFYEDLGNVKAALRIDEKNTGSRFDDIHASIFGQEEEEDEH